MILNHDHQTIPMLSENDPHSWSFNCNIIFSNTNTCFLTCSSSMIWLVLCFTSFPCFPYIGNVIIPSDSYTGFLKWGYLQITHFRRMFPQNKPSCLGIWLWSHVISPIISYHLIISDSSQVAHIISYCHIISGVEATTQWSTPPWINHGLSGTCQFRRTSTGETLRGVYNQAKHRDKMGKVYIIL